jgi:hypothetical protein
VFTRRIRRRVGRAVTSSSLVPFRRASVATILGLALVGATLAQVGSATTLNASAGSLGAGSAVVSSCDTNGVISSYKTNFDASLGAYAVTAVTISNLAVACDGKQLQIVVTNADGVSVGSALVPTLNIPPEGVVTVPLGTVSAESARGMAIVISG